MGRSAYIAAIFLLLRQFYFDALSSCFSSCLLLLLCLTFVSEASLRQASTNDVSVTATCFFKMLSFSSDTSCFFPAPFSMSFSLQQIYEQEL